MTGRLVHFLRHGAPVRPGLLLGRTDAPPDPAGVTACLARAADLRLDAVVSSDLARARLPGERIAQASDVPCIIDPRWREMDFGDWDGLAPHDVDAVALSAFYEDPDHSPPPGGERWSDLTRRGGAALSALPPGDVLVVTHGGAIRAALACLCAFDHRQGWAFNLPYAALLTVRIWPAAETTQIIGLRT